ncbi:hypothetical protein GJ496_003473 [Pomphorhynchus laevis]|nr:hypothetical protein GJ496_003473 [Pomphorhynchus laevis]
MIDAYIDKCIEIKDSKINSSIHVADKIRKQFPHSISKYLQTKLISGIKSQNNNLVMSERFINCSWILFNLCYDESTIIQLVDVIEFTCYKNLPSNLLNEFNPGYKHAFKMYIGILQALMNIPYSCQCFNFESLESKYRKLENRIYQNKISNILSGALKCQMARQINTEQKNLGEKQFTFTDDCQSRPLFALLPSELESSSTDFVWYNVCETDEFIRKVEKKVKSIFTTKDTIEQIYKRFTIDGIGKEVEMINRFCTQYDDLHNISDKSINIQQGPLIDENVYNNLDQFGHQIEEIHKCPLFCFGTKYNHNLKHSVNFLLTVLNLNNPSYGGQSIFDIKFTFLKLHQILNDASFNEGDTLITKEVYSKRIPGIVKEINYSTRGDCKCALVCTKDFCEFDLESDIGVQIKSWSSDFVLTVDIKNDWTIDIIDVCMDATKVCWLPYPFVMAYITTTGNLVIKKYNISNTFEEQIFEPPYCIIDATFCQIDSQRFENESKHLCGDVVIFLLEKYGSVYYVNLSRFNRNLSNINDDYSVSNKIDFYHEECAKISTLHYCHQLNYLFVTCVMTRTVAWRVRFLTELVFEPIVDVSNDSLSIIPNLSITSFDLSPNLYGLKLCEVYRSTEFITAVMHIDADHFFIEYLPGDCNVRLYPTYDESKAFIVTQTHVNPEEPCFTISTIKRKFFPVYYRTQSALFENFFLIRQQQNLAYGSPLTKYMKHHIFTEIEVTSKDLMEIYPKEMINTAISNFTNIRHSKDFVVNLLMKKKPSDTLILELKANQLYSKLIPNCVVIQNDCFVIKPFDNYADIVLGPEHETSKHINLEIKIRNPEHILKLAMLDGVSVYERRFLDVCKSLSDISLYPCEYLHSSDYQVSVHSHCPCESYLSYIIEIITMKLSLFYTANTDLQVTELDLLTQVLNHVVAQYHSPAVIYSTVNLLSLLGIEISSNFYFKLVNFDQSNNTSPMISIYILAMMLIHSEVDNNVVSKFASKMTNEQYNDFVKYLKKELLSYPSSFLAIIPGNAYLLTGNEMSFNCYCGYLFAMLNKLSLILDSDKEDELHKTFDFSDFIVNNLIFNMIKEDKCFYPYIMLLNNILTLGAYPEISLSIDKFAIETNVAFDEIEEISESKKAYERFNTLVFLENAGHIYDFSNLTLAEDVNVDTSVALTDPSVVHDHADYNFFTVNENVYDVVDDVNDDTISGDDNSTTTIENDTNNLNFVCKAMYLNNDSIQTNSTASEEIKRLLEFPYRLLTLILDRLYDVINTKNKLLTAKQLYTIFNTLFDIWGYFWCNAIKLDINDTSLSSLVNNIVYRIIQMIASGTLKLDLETVTSKIPDSDIFVICFFTMIFSERINRDLRRSERIKTIQNYSNYLMDLFCRPSFQKTVFSVIFFDHRNRGFKRDEINNDLKDIQSNFNLVEYLSPDFCWNDYKGCTLDGSMVIYDLRWETFQALYMRMFIRNLKCIYGQSGKISREFLKNNEFMSLLRNAYGL